MPRRQGPRQEVMWFARKMEAELRKNDHKGGWEHCADGYLLRRIADEHAELARLLKRVGRKVRAATTGSGVTKADAEEIVSEAADIANFAMMIADNWKYFTERERGP